MVNKMENINDVTMEKNYTVYMHVSPKGKVYIGITRQIPEKRWLNGNGYKYNEYFWRAIQKYDWNNFKHIIIENNLSKKQAENMEIELIAKYRSNDREYGYNIESGGNAIGKTSEETRKKMSDNNRGENNPQSKKVYCDGMIFGCVTDCANYYGLNNNTIYTWIKGQNNIPLDFQKLNLRYATNDDINKCEKYDIEKHGDKASIVITINKGSSKFIHCNGIIFNTIKECANYYNVNASTMQQWINGKVKMNEDFQKLNLRYATNDDINKCEKYDSKKHGDKASIVITINENKGSSKFIHCNGIIFNTIKECANYYNVNRSTMKTWINGKVKMNEDFQKLNLRYATENDLNECEKYDSKKHGDKASIVITINENKGKKKDIHCNGMIFNSMRECANYYNVNVSTIRTWLMGNVTMPVNFQKLNLRFATNEDLNTYPRYTLANN